MKHNTKIVFGKEQVDKYLNGSEFSFEEEEMYIKNYSFETELELIAFLKGVNETVGWAEIYQIELSSIR